MDIRAPRNAVVRAVLDHIQTRAGHRVTLDDLRRDVTFAATGYNGNELVNVPDAHPSVTQVQHAMRRITDEEMWPIVTIIRGQVWRVGEREQSTITPPTPTTNGDSGEESTATTDTHALDLDVDEPAPEDIDPTLADLEAMVEADVDAELNGVDEPALPGLEEGWGEKGEPIMVPEGTADRIAHGAPDVRSMPPMTETVITGPGPNSPIPDPHIGRLFEYLAGRPDGYIFMRGDDGYFYAATLKRLN